MNASIVIPAYNAEKTLGECLNALQKQESAGEFEVIVVDDGSTDNSHSIAKEFAKKDNRFSLIRQKNSGPASARNAGAKIAKHEIIVFLDSDCVAEKNWLEEMLKPFADRNVVGVQGAYKSMQKEIIAQFNQLEIEQRYEIMQKQKTIDWIGSYSAAYRKEVFLKEGGFDEGFLTSSGEDPDLSYTLSEKGYRLVFDPKAVVFHYHPSTLLKYLKTKYYRAFWRVRLYKKHKGKIFSDSYTPHEIKLQIACFYAAVLLIALSFFIKELFFGGTIMLFLIIVLSIPFSVWAFSKNRLVAIIAPVIIFLRTAAFGLGLLAGLQDRRVAK